VALNLEGVNVMSKIKLLIDSDAGKVQSLKIKFRQLVAADDIRAISLALQHPNVEVISLF
jgi:inosine-uridine nucleoside N-ribohydrolase